ncbi:MAG: hypothetical protein EXS00_02110 [Phycisphaerales bacterium]|nr:hypothetical protein [Phycisphaerales bacterium]
MHRLVFIAAMLIGLVLDASFVPVLEVGGVRPSVLLVLVVFVCLCGERDAAKWAAIAGGLSLDLSNPVVLSGAPSIYVVGPNLLGFLFGAQLLGSLRGVLLKRSVLAMAVATLLFAAAAAVVVVFVWSARLWIVGPPVPWDSSGARSMLWSLALSGVLSSLLALPLGWLLIRSFPMWGFPSVGSWGRR